MGRASGEGDAGHEEGYDACTWHDARRMAGQDVLLEQCSKAQIGCARKSGRSDSGLRVVELDDCTCQHRTLDASREGIGVGRDFDRCALPDEPSTTGRGALDKPASGGQDHETKRCPCQLVMTLMEQNRLQFIPLETRDKTWRAVDRGPRQPSHNGAVDARDEPDSLAHQRSRPRAVAERPCHERMPQALQYHGSGKEGDTDQREEKARLDTRDRCAARSKTGAKRAGLDAVRRGKRCGHREASHQSSRDASGRGERGWSDA